MSRDKQEPINYICLADDTVFHFNPCLKCGLTIDECRYQIRDVQVRRQLAEILINR